MIRHAAVLTLLLAALPATAAEWIGQLPEADKHGIEAAAIEADARWNARDASGLAAMYTEDATLVVGSGALTQGADAVLGYFKNSFARAPAALRHTTVLDRLIVLAPDLVLVDTRVALDQVGEGAAPKRVRDFNTMTLLAKRDGRWKFVTVRAYPVAPASPVAAPTQASR